MQKNICKCGYPHYSNYNNFNGFIVNPIFKDGNLNTYKDFKKAIKKFKSYSEPVQDWIFYKLSTGRNTHKKFINHWVINELPKIGKTSDDVFDLINYLKDNFSYFSLKRMWYIITQFLISKGIYKPFSNALTDESVDNVRNKKKRKNGKLITNVSYNVISSNCLKTRGVRQAHMWENKLSYRLKGKKIQNIDENEFDNFVEHHNKCNLIYLPVLLDDFMTFKITVDILYCGNKDRAEKRWQAHWGQIGTSRQFFESIGDVKSLSYLDKLIDWMDEQWEKAKSIYEYDLEIKHLVLGDN